MFNIFTSIPLSSLDYTLFFSSSFFSSNFFFLENNIGACLGIGLSAMGTGSLTIYEQLKTVLFTDRAVAGEGAAIAMGLLLMGTPKEGPIEEMLQYAKGILLYSFD